MQRIEVKLGRTTDGYDLTIQSVYKIEEQLIVISKIKTPHGIIHPTLEIIGDEINVETGTKQELPVIHYLLNDKKNVETYNNANFIPLDSVDNIQDLLSEATCIYKRRKDKLNPLRLHYFESANKNDRKIEIVKLAETNLNATAKPNNIQNIFAFIDNENIKIVFEEILKSHYASKDVAWFMGNMFNDDDHSLKDFLMMSDDILDFEAFNQGTQSKFSTTATEFVLPHNKPELIIKFLMLLEAYQHYIQSNTNENDTFHIQVSAQSIYACFDDLYIVPEYQKIINTMPLSIEEFINKPGTYHYPNSIAALLYQSLIRIAEKPDYKGLKTVLERFDNNIGFDHIRSCGALLYNMYRLNGMSAEKSMERLQVVNELESLLKKDAVMVLPFIKEFSHKTRAKLVDYAASRMFKIKEELRKDITVLYNIISVANFKQREDGRISIDLLNNEFYQKYYSTHDVQSLNDKSEGATRQTTALSEALATILQVEIANDSSLNELIFTEKSSMHLKSFGVHLTEKNLQAQLEQSFQSLAAREDVCATMTESITSTASHPYQPAKFNFEKNHSKGGYVLEMAGIATASSYHLLDTHPQSLTILPIMQKAGVFTDDVIKNKNCFAHLISQLDIALKNNKSDALIELYQLLNGEENATCYLTPKIYKAIWQTAVYYDIDTINMMLKQLQPLTPPMVNTLFKAPQYFIMLYNAANQWHHPVDNLKLMLQTCASSEIIRECAERLHYGKKPWLTEELFQAAISNMEQCRPILHGLIILHKHDLLKDYKDVFLKNPSFDATFTLLTEIACEDEALIKESMSNPDIHIAATAVKRCVEMFYIHHKNEVLLNLLLVHKDVMNLINQIAEPFKDWRLCDKEEYRNAREDIKLLLSSIGVEIKTNHMQLSFFNKDKPNKVELIKSLKTKYNLKATHSEVSGYCISNSN